MYTDIFIGIAVLIFAILSYFIIKTLIALQKNLKRTEEILTDVEWKLTQFDSMFLSISELGDVCEKTTCKIQKKAELNEDNNSLANQLIDWGVITLSVAKQFLQRR